MMNVFSSLRQSLRAIVLVVLTLCVGCASTRAPIAPGTVPTQESTEVTASDIKYGQQVLQAFKTQFPISHDAKILVRLRGVVEKLADAAGAGASGWQVYLFEGDRVLNAAATRGNFIFVWTGLMNKVESDDELATVLAHEMGHVLARHTYQTPQEQANQAISGVAGAATHGILISNTHSALARLGASLVQQVVAAAIINPESQRLELEADHIGLFLMARAGYNPESAITFWRKLASSDEFQGMSLNFLSTHPSSDQRIEQIESLLPEARQIYQGKPARRPIGQTPQRPKTRGNTGEEWKVLEEWTELYAHPDASLQPSKRYHYGQKFQAIQEGRWLKVLTPDQGYVRSRDCAPLNP